MSLLGRLGFPVFGGRRRGSFGQATLALPQYLSDIAPVQVHDVEDAASWTQVAGTVSDDSTVFSQGSHGVKLATTAGTNTPIARSPVISLDMSAGTHVGFDVYVHESGTVNRSLFLIFWNTRGTNVSMSKGSIGLGRIGWNRIQIAKSAFTAGNGGSFSSTVTEVEVRLAGSANGQSVTVDNFQLLTPRPAVMWNFHDAWAAFHTIGLPAFSSRNMAASLVLPTSESTYIGTAGHLTWAQARAIVNDNGWTLINHTQTHPDMSAYTQQQCEDEIAACDADYTANGLTPTPYYCSPNGTDNATLRLAWAAQGKTFCLVTSQGETVTWPQPDHLRIGMAAASTSLATMQSRVDSAITNKTTLMIACHNIADTDSETTQATLEGTLDYCITNEVPVLTWEQLHDLQSGPIEIPAQW